MLRLSHFRRDVSLGRGSGRTCLGMAGRARVGSRLAGGRASLAPPRPAARCWGSRPLGPGVVWGGGLCSLTTLCALRAAPAASSIRRVLFFLLFYMRYQPINTLPHPI